MKEFCVDLELAKELKENGFSQEGEYYFSRSDGQENLKGDFTYDFSSTHGEQGKFERIYNPKLRYEYYFAPTSDEILKELPNNIDANFELYINKLQGSYIVEYVDFSEIYGHNLVCLLIFISYINRLGEINP